MAPAIGILCCHLQALIERDLELLKQFKEGAQVKVVNTHPEGAVKTTILAE